MRILYILTALCFICVAALAQQRPQLSQYMQNNYLINPAVAGIESYADLRTGVRQQWAGVEGAPSSMYVSIQTSLNKNDRNVQPASFRKNHTPAQRSGANRNNRFYVNPHHGIGAIIQTDKAGLLRSSSFNVSYSYHLPVTRSLNLSGGVYTGVMQHNINQRDLILQTSSDPFIAGNAFNIVKFDLGVGLWLYSRDYYLGVSGTQLIRSSNDVFQPDEGPRGILQPHYFVTSGYRFRFTDDFNITPSVMLKIAEGGQTALDINAKAYYIERVWGGISYRHEESMAAMVGFHVNYLMDVSYSYDFSTSDMGKAYANSHEVVLGIKLNNPHKVTCPQWIW